MNFIVIIPARYASSRLPGKPLADVHGKPMVIRVAEQARRSGASEIIVATDDERIAHIVRAHGHEAVMTRKDHATGTDRLAEVAAMKRYGARRIIVNVQGDEPLIAPSLIRQVAENLGRSRAAQIATACHPIRDPAELANPNAVKVVLDRAGYALYFSRAPIPYARDAFARGVRAIPKGLPVYRHLGIYAYRASFLQDFKKLTSVAIEKFEALEQLRALAYGYRISVAVSRAAHDAGIDTPADLERVRRLLRQAGRRASKR